jgi:ATP-dependent exoDNAse (exonuclease V) alpha subunit
MTGSDRLRLSTVRSKESKELLGQLPLIPGMPVIMTENLSMPHKVVNGSEGVLRDVIYHNVPEGREAVCAYVQMPASSLQVNGLERSLVPIFPQSMQFTYTTSSRSKIKISRSQLPLIPGWAFTDYKVQGASLESVIVDLYSAQGLQNAYVMLSRVKSLCRLGVLCYFPPHHVFCRL